jgi:S-DNA-T family DNA segregation ATPase FtsK/SpoIIIE
MARSSKNTKKNNKKTKKKPYLAGKIKRLILGILFFLIAIVVGLSFFNLAGIGGRTILKGLALSVGNTRFFTPLVFAILGWIIIDSDYRKLLKPSILIFLLLIVGISGILAALEPDKLEGGWIGYIVSWPLLQLFGVLVTQIIFGAMIVIAVLITWQALKKFSVAPLIEKDKEPIISRIIKKVREPKLKIEEIEPVQKVKTQEVPQTPSQPALKEQIPSFTYQPPPLDLLESDKETPHSGDIRNNSSIIKKTLENFGIQVEMSGVNVGPTVTQYTFKPAEGIKLSRITSLSNNLALALASHPIRIEAPIPGKSLVGIEIPNKVRVKVRLRNLIEDAEFQQATSPLAFALGKDVSGEPIFADLSRMPHLLVAGSTGTGKTIFLNSLIMSLLYRNSPEILRLILVDPKRVEFPIYNDIPHLLCPVILTVDKTINILHWLIKEMERRFEVLSESKVRDISSFNEKAVKDNTDLLPYIILIVDELADLMAAKGKEVEAGIVRLAQLARAVGIHLVVATQRPSVEVITGLIKANITSRITCQVASQVDSRTVIDMAGAERLLGLGDTLFISAEILKPKRIQGAYVSQKEVRKVVKWIKSHTDQEEKGGDELAEDLQETLDHTHKETPEALEGETDPLYEEAKQVVIEAGKASASLLQRKLRIGYARAARILDTLENNGIVGPLNGAKPREVYFPLKEDEEEFA